MTSLQTPLDAHPPTSGPETVTDFLLALEDADIDRALSALTNDIQWINVSLPTVQGKAGVERIFRSAQRAGGGFRVHFHTIAQAGDIVLTERTDAVTLGRFEHRFWVVGRFELRDGKICVWRDAFDWGDLLVGFVRALAGIAVPALNRPWPDE
ncbi:MAG: nuclear transport factor 2 family protein [Thermoleophilaceae bacterium]|nr:nuclear transport factor 2 family protein [Thermoleophilaceae bacterium]